MKVLIIEDEATAAHRLEKLIREIDKGIHVLDILDSIEATLQWWLKYDPPDLIFLDIHLADGSSFEIFHHVEIDCPIIFTTAFDEYAVEAFKVNAIDYLLKPIKKVEIETALKKHQKLLQATGFDYSKLAKAIQKDNYSKRFLIRFGQQIRVVEMSSVAYFYTQDKITFVITKEGKRYPLDYSLEKLEELVNPAAFFRINRQFILNIDAIKEMYAYSKSRVRIDLTPACELETIVSTERSPLFKKWLAGE